MNEWMSMLGIWYHLIETFIWMNDVCHSLKFLLNLIFNKNFWMDTLHLIYCCQVFEDKNVFWNFISKQVDLINGIMSLSRMYFNTVFRQFFLRFHLYFDSRPSSCEGGRLSCQRVTKYGPQCRHLVINGDTTPRPSDPIVN